MGVLGAFLRNADCCLRHVFYRALHSYGMRLPCTLPSLPKFVTKTLCTLWLAATKNTNPARSIAESAPIGQAFPIDSYLPVAGRFPC